MSVSTVSRAFYPDASIAVETRKTVLEHAAKIGYRSSLVVQSLITKKTKIAVDQCRRELEGRAVGSKSSHTPAGRAAHGENRTGSTMSTVLVLGSGPNALEAASWPRSAFDEIVVINNAWQVREDWSYLIHPDDFPEERRPDRAGPSQQIITSDSYVPAQNRFGGFVFAGGTMSFTAAYWALDALQPSAIAFFGCDMVYPATSQTHFYGTGTADPLRKDITLRSLEAKSCRLRAFAASQACALVNLSARPSRLSIPTVTLGDLGGAGPDMPRLDRAKMDRLVAREKGLGYFVDSGRYWEREHLFDPVQIDAIDRQWLAFFDDAPLALAG
jgi:hypothetical protein